MVTTQSIVRGSLVAGTGIALGILGDYFMSNVAQGSVAYFNDVANTMGNIALAVGVLGGLGAGAYELFLGPSANPAANPPTTVRNIRIVNRGGRNTYRF